jgi:hypothetical protein
MGNKDFLEQLFSPQRLRRHWEESASKPALVPVPAPGREPAGDLSRGSEGGRKKEAREEFRRPLELMGVVPEIEEEPAHAPPEGDGTPTPSSALPPIIEVLRQQIEELYGHRPDDTLNLLFRDLCDLVAQRWALTEDQPVAAEQAALDGRILKRIEQIEDWIDVLELSP